MPVFLSRPYGGDEETPWGHGEAHPSIRPSSVKNHPVVGDSAHDHKIDDLIKQSHLQQSFYSQAKSRNEDVLEAKMNHVVEEARMLCQHDLRREQEMADFLERQNAASLSRAYGSYKESASEYRNRILKSQGYDSGLCMSTPEGMLQYKKRIAKQDDFESAEEYVDRISAVSGCSAERHAHVLAPGPLPRTNGEMPNNFDNFSVIARQEALAEKTMSPLAQARAATKKLQKAQKNEWKHGIGFSGQTLMQGTPLDSPYMTPSDQRAPEESPAQKIMGDILEDMDNNKTEKGEITVQVMENFISRSRKKFNKFDVDANGLLEGAELENLAEWVWKCFQPGGEPISHDIREKETQKLLLAADENGDGCVSFEEFESWFKKTCVDVQRAKIHKAKVADSPLKPAAVASSPAPVPKSTSKPVELVGVLNVEPDEPETGNISVAVVDRVLSKAEKKFNKFDRDKNGRLDLEELEAMAEWVWRNFHPGGEPIPQELRESEASKLLSRHDSDNDGSMDLAEFESWFKKTCVAIERFRLHKAKSSPAEKKKGSPSKPKPSPAKAEVDGEASQFPARVAHVNRPSPAKGEKPKQPKETIQAAPAESVQSEALEPKSVINMMHQSAGYTVVIVCTSSQGMEDYWQARLEAGRGQVCGSKAEVIVVHEDWPGGAGNGLGSLYAYKKACDKAGKDLAAVARDGGSLVIYHTAGKGTRLAPLPGSEGNNKPGVKLPSQIALAHSSDEHKSWFDENSLLTILEAVILQTSLYAKAHAGRLAVYWGDQVFVPTENPEYTPDHHADIMAKLGEFPSEEGWKAGNLHKYGLVAVAPNSHAVQLEKVSYQTAKDNLPASCLESGKIGTSLGSFSISVALLEAFMGEFSAELAAKKGKLDTDPHWWMPMTLNEETYNKIMESKGDKPEQIKAHFNRMTEFKRKFLSTTGSGPAHNWTNAVLSNEHVLGGVGIGPDCYWWDYGQLKLYRKNMLLASKDNDEAEAYRLFLKIAEDDRTQGSQLGDTKVDNDSVVLCSEVGKGKIKDSVVAKCRIGKLEVEDSILVNVTASKIKGKGLTLYNVCEDQEDGLELETDTVRADIFSPTSTGSKMSMTTNVHVDGGRAWFDTQKQNKQSYAEVYEGNQGADMVELTNRTNSEHEAVAQKLGWFKSPADLQRADSNGWSK
jgi:Ca2+-binding EF-hand superfamily protein